MTEKMATPEHRRKGEERSTRADPDTAQRAPVLHQIPSGAAARVKFPAVARELHQITR